MTSTGTFIINGAERVIVSQLVRSPGAYYDKTIDQTGKNIFTAQVIPNRGAWIEFETDTGIDARRPLFNNLKESGICLLELSPVNMTLEDIFINYAGKEA